MPDRQPIVSVCIPTYNRAGMLKEAIESVLTQTYRDFELIVSDNASTDETEALMKAFDDPRIRYVRNKQGIFYRENWNQCLALARGQYISLLPDDDQMMPENLEAKVEMFMRHPNVGLVHSKYHIMDETGRIVQRNATRGPARDEDAVEPGWKALETLLKDSRILESTVTFSRALYGRLGGFSSELVFCFDYEYWMRLIAHSDVGFIARPLVKWRRHSGQVTASVFFKDGKLGERAFRDIWKTNALIVRRHTAAAPNRRLLRHIAFRKIIVEANVYASQFGHDRDQRHKLRMLMLELCWSYPEILLDKGGWAVMVESVVGPRLSGMIKLLTGMRAWS